MEWNTSDNIYINGRLHRQTRSLYNGRNIDRITSVTCRKPCNINVFVSILSRIKKQADYRQDILLHIGLAVRLIESIIITSVG
jgi:hypothetical protein